MIIIPMAIFVYSPSTMIIVLIALLLTRNDDQALLVLSALEQLKAEGFELILYEHVSSDKVLFPIMLYADFKY